MWSQCAWVRIRWLIASSAGRSLPPSAALTRARVVPAKWRGRSGDDPAYKAEDFEGAHALVVECLQRRVVTGVEFRGLLPHGPLSCPPAGAVPPPGAVKNPSRHPPGEVGPAQPGRQPPPHPGRGLPACSPPPAPRSQEPAE